MGDRPSLRERHRQRTRDEIVTAAFALFAERGFDATTIEQIAGAAGVSPRTVFRHFSTKEDIVFGDHAESVARLREALREADQQQPPLWRVRRAVLAVQNPGGHPEREVLRARLIAEVPAVRARAAHLSEAFEAAVADDLVRPLGTDAEARALAEIAAGAIFGALRGARRAASSQDGVDPRWLVETAFALAEDGIARRLPPRSN
jgi:AcrR family transcriptional regulator